MRLALAVTVLVPLNMVHLPTGATEELVYRTWYTYRLIKYYASYLLDAQTLRLFTKEN